MADSCNNSSKLYISDHWHDINKVIKLSRNDIFFLNGGKVWPIKNFPYSDNLPAVIHGKVKYSLHLKLPQNSTRKCKLFSCYFSIP